MYKPFLHVHCSQILRDSNGNLKGIAFVEMASVADARTVVRALNDSLLEGVKLTVRLRRKSGPTPRQPRYFSFVCIDDLFCFRIIIRVLVCEIFATNFQWR